MEVLKREKDGMIQRVKCSYQHPIGTTDTGSVLPTQGRYYRWGPTQGANP
jgi:hypothetical protein